MIDFKNTIVICLGLGNYKVEDWYQANEMLKVECPKYGIEYIDTSKDREKVLIEILEKLSREIEKNNIIFY